MRIEASYFDLEPTGASLFHFVRFDHFTVTISNTSALNIIIVELISEGSLPTEQ